MRTDITAKHQRVSIKTLPVCINRRVPCNFRDGRSRARSIIVCIRHFIYIICEGICVRILYISICVCTSKYYDVIYVSYPEWENTAPAPPSQLHGFLRLLNTLKLELGSLSFDGLQNIHPLSSSLQGLFSISFVIYFIINIIFANMTSSKGVLVLIIKKNLKTAYEYTHILI